MSKDRKIKLHLVDPTQPLISFAKFKEIWSRNHDLNSGSKTAIDGSTRFNTRCIPKFKWSLNPGKDHPLIEYLNSDNGERLH